MRVQCVVACDYQAPGQHAGERLALFPGQVYEIEDAAELIESGHVRMMVSESRLSVLPSHSAPGVVRARGRPKGK